MNFMLNELRVPAKKHALTLRSVMRNRLEVSDMTLCPIDQDIQKGAHDT